MDPSVSRAWAGSQALYRLRELNFSLKHMGALSLQNSLPTSACPHGPASLLWGKPGGVSLPPCIPPPKGQPVRPDGTRVLGGTQLGESAGSWHWRHKHLELSSRQGQPSQGRCPDLCGSGVACKLGWATSGKGATQPWGNCGYDTSFSSPLTGPSLLRAAK